MDRNTLVVALRALYTFYATFTVLPILLVARTAHDLLAVPPLLLLIYVLYMRDKKSTSRRRVFS